VENEEQEYKWSEKPDVDDLKGDLDRCRNNLSYFANDADEARDLRFSVWPGKNKRNRKEGTDAFPWQGASDMSIGLIDQNVTEDIAILKRAVVTGNMKAVPTEGNDIRISQLVGKYMRWTLSTMQEFQRETTILANNMLMYGAGVVGVYWKRKIDRYYEQITIDEIAESMPDLAEAIMAGDESAKELMQEAFPKMKKRKTNRMVKELATQGFTDLPSERLVENRPCIRAYEVGREIIFDSNVLNDIQNARSVYCIHHHTPEDLREKVLLEGYDEAFVDDVIKMANKGQSSTMHPTHNHYVNQVHVDHTEGLIKLVTCYRRVIDEDGVPLITQTIFSEDSELFAKHEINKYGKGVYPFTAFTRETINHRLLDSRGIAEVLRPYEQGIKVEQDMRIDRASLSTIPPVQFLVGRKPERIGPGSFVPVRRPGEVSFLDIPQYSPASMEVEQSLRNLARQAMGRPTSEEDKVEATLIRQDRISTWLDNWRPVLKQIWHLQKLYGGEESWMRALSNEQDVQVAFDDVAEFFDFTLTFDANSLDQAQSLERLKTLGDIFGQFDREGVGRYDEFLKLFAESIDPTLADRLIMPKQEASEKEAEETSADLAKIASGQVVNAPQNANVQMRMGIINNFLQGTEEIPATDVQNRYQSDEQFKARIDNYMKMLQHQEQQRKNALTGRMGAPAGNAPPTSQA
jgi:hypothetical protein